MYTNQTVPKVAEKNILVSKVTSGGFIFSTKSQVQSFSYRKFKKYKAYIFPIDTGYGNLIDEGFHYYINPQYKYISPLNYRGYSYFIIPKGTEYYEGGDNTHVRSDMDITVGVANQIIYIGRRNWFNRLIAKIFYDV